MTKHALIVAIGLVIIVAVIAVIVSNDPEDEPRDVSGNASENMYLNNEFGISFEIPDGYEKLEVTNPDSGRHSVVLSKETKVPQNGEGPPAITLDIFTTATSTNVRSWAGNTNVSNLNLVRGGVSEIDVDGASGITYLWDGLYPGRSIVFPHRGNIFMLSGTYLEISDPIYSDFDAVARSLDLR